MTIYYRYIADLKTLHWAVSYNISQFSLQPISARMN